MDINEFLNSNKKAKDFINEKVDIKEAESCKTEEDAQISGSLGNIATGQTGINKSDELEINEAADGKNGYFIIKSKDDSVISGPFEKDAALSRSNKLNTQNDDPTYSSVAELNNGKIINYVDSKGHSYKENAGGGDGQSTIPQKSVDDKKETAKEIEEDYEDLSIGKRVKILSTDQMGNIRYFNKKAVEVLLDSGFTKTVPVEDVELEK